MNCPSCSNPSAPEAKFCTKCGTALPRQPVSDGQSAEHTPAVSVKKLLSCLKNWKILLCAAAVPILLLAVITALFLLLPDNNGFITYKQDISVFSGTDGLHAVIGKKVLDGTIDAPYDDQYCSSLDGTVATFLAVDQLPSCVIGDSSSTPGKSSLYVVDGSRVTKVADDVTQFQLSASGEGLAYVTPNGDTYTLTLYSVSKQKGTHVTDNMGSSYEFALSPNGKSVAYYAYSGPEDAPTELIYFDGQKSVAVTSEYAYLLGLSNGGRYIYTISSEGEDKSTLYSYNVKGECTRLGAISGRSVKFNSTHTQIMFYRDGKTYISTKGRKPAKVSDNRLYLVTAPNSQSASGSLGYAITYPVSNLYDHVYTSSDGENANAWLIKKNPSRSQQLASKVSDSRLDESAKYLYFVYDQKELRVLKISNGDKAFERSKLLAADVDCYEVTSNRDLVYFMVDDSLYCVNGKRGGKVKTIASAGVEAYRLTINRKDVVYYIADGDLYACKNGRTPTCVATGIKSVFNTSGGTVYAYSEDAIYATTGSKKLKKILLYD